MIYEFYLSIIFIFVVLIISMALILVSDAIIEEVYDASKASVYECGFQPIDMDLQQFDVKFYIVGLLFLVFDVEIAFFLPLFSVGYSLLYYSILVAVIFINCFFVTFIYEWRNKFLDWG